MTDPLPLALRQRSGLIASIAMILFLTIFSNFASPASAAKSLVTVYADNQERSISTTVVTVGDALEKADIQIGDHDLVEPSIDTFINEAVFKINVYRARPVTIIDESIGQKTIMSPYKSPRLIAEAAGIEVFDEDEFVFELIDDILTVGAVGERLVINRSTPVSINLYGDVIEHRTHADTVGEVLAEAGVVLGDKDQLVQNLDDLIVDNMMINVVHFGTKVINETVATPFEVEYIHNSNMFSGQTEVKTKGQTGESVITYEVELENNIEINRTKLQEVVRSKPITEVRIVGTKVVDPSSNVAIGQSMAAQRGWVDAEWQCLYSLWTRESNWNHLAENPSSGAYGIPQSLPASKMATVGADYLSNPATQITWGLNYIQGRYGSPCGAWAHSESHNWY